MSELCLIVLNGPPNRSDPDDVTSVVGEIDWRRRRANVELFE